jgi:hypothetical protein
MGKASACGLTVADVMQGIIQHRCHCIPSIARTVADSVGVKQGREAVQQARRRSIRTAASCSKLGLVEMTTQRTLEWSES